MDSIWQDLRHIVQGLLRKPGYAAVAVLTIALGIGANTAIFSVVHGVLLEPLPFRNADRLVMPQVISPKGYPISLSIPNFKDWRAKSRSFSSFGANMSRSVTLTGVGRPQVIDARYVLGDFFETLGVKPYRGRLIASDQTWAGAAPLAVVTYGFWQNQLGGAANVLGRTLTLDGEPYQVVGVTPPGFVFPSADTKVFLPMGYLSARMCWDDRGCSQGTWAIARLKDGVTLRAAQADLDRVAHGIEAEAGQPVAVAKLGWLRDNFVGDVRTPILILMGAVGFVLLVVCVNMASLALSRGESRRREIAVRLALGSGRARIVKLFLMESILLGLIGGVLGVLIAYIGTPLLVAGAHGEIPSMLAGRVGLDGTVLAFTCAVSLGAGLLFGLMPALRATKVALAGELREGGRGGMAGRARGRLRAGLVVAEVALSLVLLIGAGLMVQSLRNLRDVDKGFVAQNVFTGRISLPRAKYQTRDASIQFFDQLLERVEALPGVTSAALSQIVPLQGNSWESGIVPEGVAPTPENTKSVLRYIVTPGYFTTLGVHLLEGRGFTATDRQDAPPVAVVDQTLAEQFWPGENPIGKRVSFEQAPESTPEHPVPLWRTVVGVVKNVHHYQLQSPARITIYAPLAQSVQSWSRSMYVVAKTAGDPLTLTSQVRRQVSALDGDVPLYQIETMRGYVDAALGNQRLVGGLLSVFSALTLLLAAIGLFGVMSFSVAQRVREIGVRMAIGADARDVLRMVLRQGLRVTVIGVVLGLIGAFALTRLLTTLLYHVAAVDPLTYVAFSAVLVGVALFASYLPARRATRVDPTVVLRDE
ncbi:MAG TPA: ABC transporter permease [Gemmatimonadales bacterium]|nr:ABC transporter permease [Gemmatimonadales bacterium]